MKRNGIIAVSLVGVFFIVFHWYNNFFSKESLAGEYINKNYNYEGMLTEIPYQPDTLRLYKNNSFTSSFFGNGNYKLKYDIMGTKIELIYDYEFGKAGYTTIITRLYGVNPKVILNKEKDHYFEKK
ncbi:hypothetical protein ACSBL2_13465 [Pedobacter sp. AW31-3R]|uniref:hypothetical protein n=1 Tax=Pedobacter sp. AW31-3R TaxID=3445781 RepID=UPI003FA0FDB1